ncbi:MAG: hypothetical protein S4CHLAM6_10530 [Chlamydiae bacterium]|nr:hypothetical protein [Chlamydiota bacterium]
MPFDDHLAHLKKQDSFKRLLFKKNAQEEGYNDYLFVDKNGYILETTIANIFWINGKKLFTPSKKLPIYFGITLQKIICAAKDLGYLIEEVYEKDISKVAQSQPFICNSLMEVLPISFLDNQACACNVDTVERLLSAYNIKRQSSLLSSLLDSLAKY